MQLLNGVRLPESWAPYSTQEDNGFELVHTPQWFVRTYVDNTSTVLNFFDAPLATDDLFSNIYPYNNSYLLKALGVYVRNQISVDDSGAAGAFASNIADVQLLINTGVLDLKIGKKDYGPFRLSRLAAGAGVWGVIASAGAEAANLTHDTGQIGQPNPDGIYKLAIPIVIPAQTQAIFRMRWPAGAVNLVGNAVLELMLEGIEARPRQ